MLGKIKYILKKNINMKTSYVVGLTVLSLFLVVGGLSVALYTSQTESRGSLNITTGNLVATLEGDELVNNCVLVEGNTTKRINIYLKNINNQDARFSLYYTPIEGVEVRSYGGLQPPSEEGIVLKQGEEKLYKVEIHNTTNQEKQIEFGSDVGLSLKGLSFPKEKKVINIGKDPNDVEDSLYNMIKVQSKGTDKDIDFRVMTINSGVYVMEESKNNTYPVYFYRGNVNNHLIFAGFCWRIVRTTETGGIKIVYNGTATDNTCVDTQPIIGTSAFNEKSDSPAYVGYMYGDNLETFSTESKEAIYGNDVKWDGSKYILQNTYQGNDYKSIANGHHYTCFSNDSSCERVHYIYFINETTSFYVTLENGEKIENRLEEILANNNDSAIKTKVDEWYKKNLDSRTDKLEDTIWCCDRSTTSGWNGFEKDGDATIGVSFLSRLRTVTSPFNKSTVLCPLRRDSFTVSELEGNGDLLYPVGLLTADEVNLAGSGYASYADDSYLKGSTQWTMTPSYFLHGNRSGNFRLYATGKMDADYESYFVFGVRPAVSLKSGTQIASGIGTSTSPYIIE